MSMPDWPTTVAAFERIFEGKRSRRPSGLKGKNFMTDEILGYVDVDGVPVEISTGTFPDLTAPSWSAKQNRIYGVTYPATADGLPDERSRMCHSLEEAFEYLYR